MDNSPRLALEGVSFAYPGGRQVLAGVTQQTPVVIQGSVRDNLLLPFRFRSAGGAAPPADAELARMLASLRLEEVSLDGAADRLSVGQRQRLALLRALLLRPEALLLDEPTSALDPAARGGGGAPGFPEPPGGCHGGHGQPRRGGAGRRPAARPPGGGRHRDGGTRVSAQDISPAGLAATLAFVLLGGAASLALHLDLHRDLLRGTVRTVAQLARTGYVLRHVFRLASPWPVLLLYWAMVAFAAAIVAGRLRRREARFLVPAAAAWP